MRKMVIVDASMQTDYIHTGLTCSHICVHFISCLSQFLTNFEVCNEMNS